MGAKVPLTTRPLPGRDTSHSAIVQLRGTSGSGKTTAMSALMQHAECAPVRTDARMLKNRVYRGRLPISGTTLYVLGDYSPHRSAGGCDTIPSIQEVGDLVEEYGTRPGAILVFEGLLLAHSWGALGEYVHPRWGERYVNAFLDTPVETCIARVTQRRAAKGRDTEGDRAAKIEKNIRDDYYRVELCYKRVVARGGVRVDINHVKAKREFITLVEETAEQYCR